MHCNVSKKTKIILIVLLIFLNLILRIPSIPHEKGADSFYIHSLANSVTTYGRADWWWNWLSIFGLYPHSYASAVPFSLSGIAQLTGFTGVEIEKTILLYSIMLGLFSIFTVYVLAGMIYDDFLFKYVMALFFSASQGTMVFSTWEISTRGPFIVFLPLFIFVLLKKMQYIKTISLLVLFGVLLAVTHHYYFFLIPITILFTIIKLLYRIGYANNFKVKISTSYIYIIGLIITFLFPFFSRTLIGSGSRYSWVMEILISNTRYIGPIIIFVFGGITYLILKNNKKFEESYFISLLLSFIPFSYNITYGAFILVLFLVFFIAVAFRNLLNAVSMRPSKLLTLIIVLNLLFFTAFSAFYNHERTGKSKSFWYMPDITYKTAVWGNKYVPADTIAVGVGIEANRMIITSDAHPSFPKVNRSEIKVDKVSPYSLTYYFEGPYVIKKGTTLSGLISWFLEMDDIRRAENIMKKLNITYVIHDSHYHVPLMSSIQHTKSSIYNNGRLRIWIM